MYRLHHRCRRLILTDSGSSTTVNWLYRRSWMHSWLRLILDTNLDTNYSSDRLILVTMQHFFFFRRCCFFCFGFDIKPSRNEKTRWECQSKVPLPVTSPALFDFLWCPKINTVIHLTCRRCRRPCRICHPTGQIIWLISKTLPQKVYLSFQPH